MRAIVVAAAVVFSALIARRASAADDLQLAWHAPPGCPSAAEVHAAALRGAPAADRASIEADVRVEHEAGWAVTITTKRAGVAAAERRLTATTCSALADATAVILS
ncbi:MAG: hypothetical protein JWP87_4567, partial [Labilithrix sp.]|nr:hypothetical protein [Labilithrix sp.]